MWGKMAFIPKKLCGPRSETPSENSSMQSPTHEAHQLGEGELLGLRQRQDDVRHQVVGVSVSDEVAEGVQQLALATSGRWLARVGILGNDLDAPLQRDASIVTTLR